MVRINILSIKQVRESSKLYNVEKRICAPDDAYDLIEVVLKLNEAAEERFGILSLNTRNEVTGVHVISIGHLNSSLVHPREVFKAAILNNAASIICFHNHPSGNPEPSREDLQLHSRMEEAGKILGIDVLDHIIIGNGKFISITVYNSVK